MKHGAHTIAIGIFLLMLITAEIIWSWRQDKNAYGVKDTLANIVILAGFQLLKYLFAGYQLFILRGASYYAPVHLPAMKWTFAACFILVDFIYYWFHRLSHKWRPLWAFHLVHHSSPYINLTTSYRLNWLTALISPFFFLPLALTGFPPFFIALSYGLNLLYQFFMHTEAVGKWGRLEGFIDSPSAHRVHHGKNPIYIDKNFGGVLMIWDRLFRTYQPETEKSSYGITTGFIGNNPLKLVFKGFIDLFTGKLNSKG
ncbi:sterol desaturase family protein [Puia sp.]|uniref:sterol desaturase family protein n=1 Tax=Puia sp. TaxID=2045100 RepID=UPI002F3E85DE